MQGIEEDHVDRTQLDARPGVGIHVETKKKNVFRIGSYVPPRVLQRVQAVVHSDNMAKQLGKMLRREAAPNAKPEKGSAPLRSEKGRKVLVELGGRRAAHHPILDPERITRVLHLWAVLCVTRALADLRSACKAYGMCRVA